MSKECRVYWGSSGCDLPRGHDSDRVVPTHRQLEPSEQRVTVYNVYLFGEDLRDEEVRLVAELWD